MVKLSDWTKPEPFFDEIRGRDGALQLRHLGDDGWWLIVETAERRARKIAAAEAGDDLTDRDGYVSIFLPDEAVAALMTLINDQRTAHEHGTSLFDLVRQGKTIADVLP